MKKLNHNELLKLYNEIKQYHYKYLKKHGVKMPQLTRINKVYIKDALVLIYLYQNYPETRICTKNEITKFISLYFRNVNDVRQARHLAAQKGWWILAGGRDNIVESLKRGEYKLHTLNRPYPNFNQIKRKNLINSWNDIKKFYKNKCITCGSEENQPHLHWTETKTILQRAHLDPNKPLIMRILYHNVKM